MHPDSKSKFVSQTIGVITLTAVLSIVAVHAQGDSIALRIGARPEGKYLPKTKKK